MTFETVIGLEIHVQLKTETKMFCSCENHPDSYEPNSSICPICMGHPGVLPVTNKKAIEFALRLSKSLGFTIHEDSKFDRKHYFYPDLPKGYQISQFDEPIATNGKVSFYSKGTKKTIRFERLHLEEDAAKMIHVSGGGSSLVDYNRAGTPLIEMVTKPDFTTPEEAKDFLRELRLLVLKLGISEGNMEKGHLRCDANISLRPSQKTFETLRETFPKFNYEMRVLWPKTEIKNMNSFKGVERAMTFEVARQTALWKEGNPPMKESTRGWNDDTNKTTEQRVKESLADYRYLPEPDLPRLVLSEEYITEVTAELPELPEEQRERFKKEYKLEQQYINVFVENTDASNFFEGVVSEIKAWEIATDTKHDVSKEEKKVLTDAAATWTLTKLFEVLHKKDLDFQSMKMTQENFAELLYILYKKKITSNVAVQILGDMVASGEDPSHIIKEGELSQVDDEDQLKIIIEKVIDENPKQAQEYKDGKEALLQFFIGLVMKETKGRANPELVKTMLDVYLQ